MYSDGGGRTGVYIAVDAVLEQLESQQNADIFSCVIYLRSCRQNLVKTLVSVLYSPRDSTHNWPYADAIRSDWQSGQMETDRVGGRCKNTGHCGSMQLFVSEGHGLRDAAVSSAHRTTVGH